MPETRSSTRGRPDPSDESEREDSSVEESEVESEEEESSDDEPAGKTILARSGITYDMKNLDDETGANASVGLRSQFEVVNCRASDSGYDFQLLDRPQVHVGSDSTTCTCSTFQSRPQAACQHIFWVLDQLHAYFHPTPSTARATLSSDGRPQVRPRAEELLASVRLEAVADRLQWQCLRDEDLQETEPTVKYTAESCVVQGDLEATIFRLAVHDDSVFSSICKAMPSGACAAIYFQKLQDQIRRLLSDFDRYCATGERPADASSPGGGVEVEEVVHQLQLAVSRIRSNIAIRSPHGSDGAADALVLILENIAARNKDCLAGNEWGRESFNGEDEDQRNLHHLLFWFRRRGVES
ncbi:Zinc finger SWIM-type [Penicillium frequentans]|nr:Zinc finger SWIM-type [Penicillium glabrum]